MRIFVYLLLMVFRLTEGYITEYVTPTGQFCPHRSDAWYQYMDHLNAACKAHQELADAAQIATAEKDQVSRKLQTFLSQWDQLAHFGQTSTDYQLSEYLAEPHMFNRQVAQIQAEWIPFCQDLSHHLKKGKQQTNDLHWLSSLKQKLQHQQRMDQFPPEISAHPFVPAVFETQSREVQLETLQLLDDHKGLINQGAQFGAFSAEKRLYYVDALRQVEDRWDIAFKRFSLIQGLNPDYVAQCRTWLAELGLDEQDYKQLHLDHLENCGLRRENNHLYNVWSSRQRGTPREVDKLKRRKGQRREDKESVDEESAWE